MLSAAIGNHMEISVFSSFCELIKGMRHDDFRMSLFKRPGVSGIIRHTASASLSGLPFGVHPVCPASESSLCPAFSSESRSRIHPIEES